MYCTSCNLVDFGNKIETRSINTVYCTVLHDEAPFLSRHSECVDEDTVLYKYCMLDAFRMCGVLQKINI
jgi:hypothetical protein